MPLNAMEYQQKLDRFVMEERQVRYLPIESFLQEGYISIYLLRQ